MLYLISPAKTLQTHPPQLALELSEPLFAQQAHDLHARFFTHTSIEQLASRLSVSTKIATQVASYATLWTPTPNAKQALPALLTFQGDVYKGLNAAAWDEQTILASQQQLLILSGLYGILRPLDKIMPYRLEMGRTLPEGGTPCLFWKKTLTSWLANKQPSSLINLASQEYASAIDWNALNTPVITPLFKDYKNGTFKTISFYAKKARGKMVAWSLQNQLTHPEQLCAFNQDGYAYAKEYSTPQRPVFLRKN